MPPKEQIVRNDRLLALATCTTSLGLAHNVEHVLRGDDGWPLTPQPSPWTYSFGFYPVILLVLFLYLRRHVGPGVWAILAAAGFLFVAITHAGIIADESPRAILRAYTSPVVGWLALGELALFLLALAATALYAARLWRRRQYR